MLSVLCAVFCIVLVILDVCRRLPLSKTKGQVLLLLPSLLGAGTPFAAFTCSRGIHALLTGFGEADLTSDMADVGWLEKLMQYEPPLWLGIPAVLVCFWTWCYTLLRTAAGVRVVLPGEHPAAAAKRQLTAAWISLPFFLLILAAGVAMLVCVLGMMLLLAFFLLCMAVIFLPLLFMGAFLWGGTALIFLAELLPYFAAMLIPYATGVFYINRYLIACGSCCGWKRAFRIFLQVLSFLPWIRWIVVCCCMGSMQKYRVAKR